MTQAELHENAANLIKGMNLVDAKFYPGSDGTVAEVILKYSAPNGGPELLSGSVYLGRSHIGRDTMA